MKKAYVEPKLTNYGTVSEITAFGRDSSRTDTFFGVALPGVPTSDNGSIDICPTADGGNTCKK